MNLDIGHGKKKTIKIKIINKMIKFIKNIVFSILNLLIITGKTILSIYLALSFFCCYMGIAIYLTNISGWFFFLIVLSPFALVLSIGVYCAMMFDVFEILKYYD